MTTIFVSRSFPSFNLTITGKTFPKTLTECLVTSFLPGSSRPAHARDGPSVTTQTSHPDRLISCCVRVEHRSWRRARSGRVTTIRTSTTTNTRRTVVPRGPPATTRAPRWFRAQHTNGNSSGRGRKYRVFASESGESVGRGYYNYRTLPWRPEIRWIGPCGVGGARI